MTQTLVAYFSATGTTRAYAGKFAQMLGADLYEIRPEIPYTQADLDWEAETSRSTMEMRDPAASPALADHNADVEAYRSILIGFPIWWYSAPAIIRTFLEAYDFSGRTIAVFATSDGTEIFQAVMEMMQLLGGKGFLRGGIVVNDPMLTEERLEEGGRGLQLPPD